MQKVTQDDQHNYTVDESKRDEDGAGEEGSNEDAEISVTSMKTSLKKSVCISCSTLLEFDSKLLVGSIVKNN